MSNTFAGKTKAISTSVQGVPNRYLELQPVVSNTVIGESFTTIPLELRYQIYSYLLLDRNAAYVASEDSKISYERTIVKFKYDTALFTVSKQISVESLEYFYSQNTFVIIETNLYSEFLQSVCSPPIPMIIKRDFCNIEYYALKIQIQHKWTDSHFPGFAIMSGRHLESWIRLPNGFNIHCINTLPAISLN
jgi:hypothetical protein